jgi:hypothetical protein
VTRIFGMDSREIYSGAARFNISRRVEEIRDENTKSYLEEMQFLLRGRC